ncbi:IucA/IucC family protein [Streptomyces oceani]|uniref:IucA/IucC family protein n=1 Tax=Streptomyces oceani TaxID=1075402 RepID=UPI001FCD683B|nr:IucA/IucC family protein [Streptomyces oceani]
MPDHRPYGTSFGRSDPHAVADVSGTENLLRCWARETGLAAPAGETLRVPLPASATALCVRVHHWSTTGWHRFGPPQFENAPADAMPLDAVTVAALLGRESGHRSGAAVPSDEVTALVGRVADSVRHTGVFLAERAAAPEPVVSDRFLEAEQGLLLGHPTHPAPKSREGLSESEARTYSPELRGAFPLYWMAVDPAVLAGDSAWCEKPGHPAGEAPDDAVRVRDLTAKLAGPAVAARAPAGCALLPLHPWQAREVRERPAVAELLDTGLLHDLGVGGDLWYPTSSVRTVYQPGAPAMLKLSLGLRITNSRRENLRKELLRGVEVHRLLRGGLEAAWQAAHPDFDIVRDPAWIGVNDRGGTPLPGLDTVIRHNPFACGDDAVCVASLTSPRPWSGGRQPGLRSRLSQVVRCLADHTRKPVAQVSGEWFARYLEAVVRPVLWLDAYAGIALEAHQQNTVVLLDGEGWPLGGRYRDNQGYYFRASHRAAIEGRLPSAGVASDSYVADEVVNERFAYYLAINNVFGLVGAFGYAGLAEEAELLSAFRRFLRTAADGTTDEPVSPLPRMLLEAPELRCKANLLTRLQGMDELIGPVDTQSVYVTVSNPLSD